MRSFLYRFFDNSSSFAVLLKTATLTAARQLFLPNKDGTLAVTSDIGTLGTQNASSVSITGGSATGLSGVTVTGTTASVNPQTGALVVSTGGLGVGGQVSAASFLKAELFGNYGLTSVANANQTFYVATTGNDSNPGTAGSPFATIQRAINVVASIYWGPYIPTIQIADGTYNEAINLPLVVGRTPTLQGNIGNFSTVVIDTSANSGVIPVVCNTPGAFWLIRNFVAKSHSSRPCIFIDNSAVIQAFGPIGVDGAASTRKFDITNSGRYLHANSRLIVYSGGVQLFRLFSAAMNVFGLQIEASAGTMNFSDALVFAQSSSVGWVGGTSPVGTFSGNGLRATDGSIVASWSASGFGATLATNSVVSGSQLTNLGEKFAFAFSFADGGKLTTNTSGALVFTSKNNTSTIIAPA